MPKKPPDKECANCDHLVPREDCDRIWVCNLHPPQDPPYLDDDQKSCGDYKLMNGYFDTIAREEAKNA